MAATVRITANTIVPTNTATSLMDFCSGSLLSSSKDLSFASATSATVSATNLEAVLLTTSCAIYNGIIECFFCMKQAFCI